MESLLRSNQEQAKSGYLVTIYILSSKMIQICKIWFPVLTKHLFVLKKGTLSM